MATSCRSVTIAMMPYFQEEIGLETFLKAKAMKQIIAREIKMMDKIAFLVSSLPTDGPIESKLSSVRELLLPPDSVCNKAVCSASLKSRDFTI